MRRWVPWLLPLALVACWDDEEEEESARTCEAWEVSFEVGGKVVLRKDPCNHNNSWKPGIGKDPSLPKNLVMELPWFLTYEFKERSTVDLLLRADLHAPRDPAAEGVWQELLLPYTYGDEDVELAGFIKVTLENPSMPRSNLEFAISGQGHVSDMYIDCGADGGRCLASYAMAEDVEFSVVPEPGWSLVAPLSCGSLNAAANADGSIGLTGRVSGNTTCELVFEPADGNRMLRLESVQNGVVNVNGGGRMEECHNNCSFSFPEGTTLSLSADADDGYWLEGWDGACAGMSDRGTLNLDTDMSCSPRFVRLNGHLVTINVVGTGLVYPSGQPGTCTADQECTFPVPTGEIVTLTAQPDPESHLPFLGWEGCAGGDTNPLQLTVDGPITCTARFEEPEDCVPGTTTLGQIQVLDTDGNLIGTPAQNVEECSVPVPMGREFILRAEGFSSTIGQLTYVWDTYWSGETPDQDAWDEEISITAGQAECRGIHLTVSDACEATEELYITVNVVDS